MKQMYPSAALAILLSLQVSAQESEGGLPWSMRHGLTLADVPVVRTPGIDRASVDAEDTRRAERGQIPADGRLVTVDADLATSGSWTTLENGDGIWRLRIESPGALGTELYFREFWLPPGGLLHVYSADGSQVMGAFSGYHNKESGIFATDLVRGESCVVEYYEPAASRGEGRFVIASLVHVYRSFSDDRAQDCEVDVNCPEGASWVPQRDGVLRLRIINQGLTYFCSGGMMNNVEQDCRRLVLTAMHCTIDEDGNNATDDDLLLWKFYWGYQRPSCGTGSATASRLRTGCVQRGESNDNGGNSGSDFFLVEVEDEPSPDWDPYWLGWDATTTTHTGGVCIHHPMGDEKKISTFTGNAQNSSGWNGLSTHYRITWSGTVSGWGVTEGGSSGSPLFNGAGRVIGTLTGGSSYCNSVQLGGQLNPDFYGRMNYHWTSNPGPATEELKTWLDPNNTGTLTLDGAYSPCTVGVTEFATLERPLLAPNPATEQVRVTFPTGVRNAERLDVMDIAGKVVRSRGLADGLTSAFIDVRGLSAGTYFVRIIADGAYLPAALLEVIGH